MNIANVAKKYAGPKINVLRLTKLVRRVPISFGTSQLCKDYVVIVTLANIWLFYGRPITTDHSKRSLVALVKHHTSLSLQQVLWVSDRNSGKIY